ncbi:hypothetical protein [Luedemannella helvata]|uniref:Uncharacterized protein n=1 Tax=Luedemannella helvata TaxID=349315 RepID=A0ABN2K6F1_9ACTN
MSILRTAARLPVLGRLVRAAAAIVAVSVAVIAFTGSAAYASIWQLTDGFDYQPASTWTVEAYGSSGGGFDLNAGTARTAPNNAYLWAQTQFSAVGRSVTLRNNSTRNGCAAAIYLTGLSGAKVNIEVINPSTWTYISLRQVTLTGGGYTQYTVPSWTGGPNTVYVRIALVGSGAYQLIRADDLIVQCNY